MQLPRSALRLGSRYAIFSDFYGDKSDSFLTLRDQSLRRVIRNHALRAHSAAMGTQAYERIRFVRGPASSKAVMHLRFLFGGINFKRIESEQAGNTPANTSIFVR